jgi:hypothetical protein
MTKLIEKTYEIENNSSPSDMINSARFFSYLGEMEKYEEIIEKIGDTHFNDGEDLIVKGWKCCYSQDPNIIVSFLFFLLFFIN